VVGTLNLDLVVRTDRRPRVGETVMGTSYVERPGGKGANQALAAADIGPTALIGAVGDDDAGTTMRRHQDAAGVDTRHVIEVAGASGRAVIEVDPDGDHFVGSLAAYLAAGSDLQSAACRSAARATEYVASPR
jgi:ribokinase